MKSLLSTTVLVTIACQAAAQNCYSADGSKLDSRYQPCFPEAENSACCMLNGTQGENQQNDICLDSGLCQATSGWYAGFLYINGCTDPANNAEGCPKLCSFLGSQYSWSVLQCEPGKFCCRAASDTTNCCNNNQSVISTSHIGSLLLPGSSSLINTTYNATSGDTPSSTSPSGNSTCSTDSSKTSASSNSVLLDQSQCPADKSATVGGAIGGTLGAALVGAIVALIFSLRSRKRTQNDLLVARATLTATEAQAVEEKANHQKQLDDQQRHIHSMPPNYPTAFQQNSGGYSARPPPPTEMDSTGSQHVSELSSGPDGSRVELTGHRSPNPHW